MKAHKMTVLVWDAHDFAKSIRYLSTTRHVKKNSKEVIGHNFKNWGFSSQSMNDFFHCASNLSGYKGITKKVPKMLTLAQPV